VILLMGIYVNSFLDRQILGLLVGPIRSTMGLSDSQVGFLMGPAFAIFYTVAGLPLGWLADRVSRRWLVAVGQLFWSIASVSFGLGRTYGQLVAARIGVGVGEASLSPSAYSMIADMFPPRRLARALSVYSMGIYFGIGLALFLGGAIVSFVGDGSAYTIPWVGDREAWQLVFFFVAAPTIPLTILLLLTFREPARRDLPSQGGSGSVAAGGQLPIGAFVQYARHNPGTVASHSLGFALLSLSGYGAGAWMPEIFIRLHGWDRAFVGQMLGANTVVTGIAGVLFGGWLADRLASRGYRDARMRVGLIAALAWLPFGIALPLMPSGALAFACLMPAYFAGAMPWGAASAAVQEYVPNRMRGQAAAVFLFTINLVGLGLGPQLLPLISDYVFRDEMQIHMSMLVVTVTAEVLAAVILWRGLPHFRRTLDYRDRWLERNSD
jgi:MFS family permease